MSYLEECLGFVVVGIFFGGMLGVFGLKFYDFGQFREKNILIEFNKSFVYVYFEVFIIWMQDDLVKFKKFFFFQIQM